MFYTNQVVIMGNVADIFEDSFVLQHENTSEFFKIYGVAEEQIAQLLLNNKVGITGHCVSTPDLDAKIILDRLTILDARGKNR